MRIIVKTYSCNYETYKNIYKDAVKRAYLVDNIDINIDEAVLEKVDLPGINIYAQRSYAQHSRTLSVFENEKLKYIIGFSNTNFDEDKLKEVQEQGGKYEYGAANFHSNSYLNQGINKIFEYYYDMKEIYPDVKLYFYLLDTDQSYAKNLSNLMNYRKLATVGFDVLNLDKISFDEYEQLGFSMRESHNDIKYISFNKFANDLLYLSRKNTGNLPSYLKCVDESYDISKENDDEETQNFQDLSNQKYIYTFKVLSAEGYDSLLTMWTLIELAQKENKNLEFLFVPEKYNFRLGQDDVKMTTDFTEPIKRLIAKANLSIKYETTDEIRQQFERERNQYEIAKTNNILRNQELFKNNMREKGIQTKCYLCGCEVENILEAAHLWGVSEIKNTPTDEINRVINSECMQDLIDLENPHHSENFYKRYVMANSGDNGVWLCSNHHGFFDNHYFCFDSSNGKILIDINSGQQNEAFFKLTVSSNKLPDEILSDKTKMFLSNREQIFKNKVTDFKEFDCGGLNNE